MWIFYFIEPKEKYNSTKLNAIYIVTGEVRREPHGQPITPLPYLCGTGSGMYFSPSLAPYTLISHIG